MIGMNVIIIIILLVLTVINNPTPHTALLQHFLLKKVTDNHDMQKGPPSNKRSTSPRSRLFTPCVTDFSNNYLVAIPISQTRIRYVLRWRRVVRARYRRALLILDGGTSTNKRSTARHFEVCDGIRNNPIRWG